MFWPFKRKPKPIPWWSGYVKFPDDTDTLSIVLSNGKILIIVDSESKVEVYENTGMYMNTKIGEYYV